MPNLVENLVSEEKDMIIAELELIAAVLLISAAAPLFPGEHLLIGVLWLYLT